MLPSASLTASVSQRAEFSELNLHRLLPCCVRLAPTSHPVNGNSRYRPACSLWPCGTFTRWTPSRGFTVSSSVPPLPRFPSAITKSTVSVGRGQSFTYKEKSYKNLIVDERHYAPADLAKAWAVDVETIRNLFREEPGVVKIGEKAPRHKRPYLTLRIPESVAVRVHKRLSE
jgi:hypothetical protein